MTTTRIASTIQLLIDLEPSLLSDLQQADSQEEIFRRLVAAGNRHDVDLDADELATHLQVVSRHSRPAELSDEMLEAVSGGTGAGGSGSPDEDEVPDGMRLFVINGKKILVWRLSLKET